LTQPNYPTLIPLPTELQGERIVLRPLVPADGPAMIAAIEESRVELDAWMDWPPAMRTEDDGVDYCIRMAAEWLRRDSLNVGIFDASTGRYLGNTGFHTIKWRLRAFEIGYWLRTSATGHGYMTEAVQLLLALAFEHLDARRVTILCDATNNRSSAIPVKLGFTHEGTHRKDSVTPAGDIRDTMVWAMLDDDYRALQASAIVDDTREGRGRAETAASSASNQTMDRKG
jgi:ribosomal-protein-serine acetyltransferase